MTPYIYWHRIKYALGNKKGQGLIEYVLIIGFVALALVLSLTSFGQGILQKYDEIIAILL